MTKFALIHIKIHFSYRTYIFQLLADISPDRMVATDGGRYDVNILRRQRSAVYWDNTPTEVRRCSWFYKGNNDGRFTPYEENIATKLEASIFISYLYIKHI